MPTEVLTDVKIYYEDKDLSGQSNSVALDHEVEVLDETTFGQTTRKRKGGVFSLGCVVSGFVDLAEGGLDEKFFDEMGGAGVVMTIVPEGEAEGNAGYTWQPVINRHSLTLDYGQIYAFEIEVTNRGAKLIRGTLLGQETAATSSASSTSRQLGLVAAGQKIYASLHVLSVSGTDPTLVAVLRSDDNSGMATPTTRITFTQATDVTSEHLSLAGAIADDDWWEIDFTIGGTDTPTFRFVVLVGIA